MNAVDRAKKNHQKSELPFTTEEEKHFEDGYYQALEDVQAELGKEVANDWEAEIIQLKQKHECEIAELKKYYQKELARPVFDDLASRHATTIMELNKEIQDKEAELKECKAKLEMVELIFGGN